MTAGAGVVGASVTGASAARPAGGLAPGAAAAGGDEDEEQRGHDDQERAREEAGRTTHGPTITGNTRTPVRRCHHQGLGCYFTLRAVPRYPDAMRSWMAGAAAAAVSCCLAVLASTAPARAQGKPPPTPTAIEEARKHMKAGAAFANDPSGQRKCEEALREFAKAYELSGSLNALKAMAICDLELERDGDAIDQYTAYLAGKGVVEATEKAQIEADLNALKEAVATVKLGANLPGARVSDVRTPAKGSPIRNAYPLPALGNRALGIHPGEHVFTASLEGYPDQLWRTEIANGGSYAHFFTFKHEQVPDNLGLPPPRAASTRPVPAAVWVTGALTVALVVPWAALSVRAKQKHDAYARVNGKVPTAEAATLRADVTHANTLADVFLAATGVSLVTSTILYFTRPTKPAILVRDRAGALYFAPSVSAVGGGAVVEGSF